MYSSYLGGSGTDGGQKVALDSLGNAYIVGSTTSTDFPTASPYQAANAGTTNVFITKLNPMLAGANSLIYSTYLGGKREYDRPWYRGSARKGRLSLPEILTRLTSP